MARRGTARRPRALYATFCPEEAWVDAPRCVRAVLGAAAREGVSVIARTPL